MVVKGENKNSFEPEYFFLLSSFLTQKPTKKMAKAIEIEWRGDEEKEFFSLLRIPCGNFVVPFLAAYQKTWQPQEFISKLLSIYRRNGYQFEVSSAERPDHIGVILEFLALVKAERKKIENELKTLIYEPIIKFSKSMKESSRHPLYIRVAEMLESVASTILISYEFSHTNEN